MKMMIMKSVEIDVQLLPYMRSYGAFYRIRDDGTAFYVSDNMIYARNPLTDHEIQQLKPSTKEEFDAAYVAAVQNIREAYLS